MKKKKVVIIGAGPGGLTSAYYILKNSSEYEVTILESENMVGGISKTVSFDDYKIDTGIHRFFTKNEEIENLWKELLPLQGKPAYDDIILNREKDFDTTGPDPEKSNECMLIKDRVTRIFYGRKFYDYPVSLNMTTIKNMGFITLFKAAFSYLKSCFIKLPNTSLENFYINRFGKVLYSMFFESYTEKVWGVHPSKISSDWGAQRVKGLSIFALIKDILKKTFKIKNNKNSETSLIEHFWYPKLGSGQIYEEMAKKITQMGGCILLNSRVNSLTLKDGKIKEIGYITKGAKKSLKTDICISSMPIKNLIESINGTNVPKKIYNIATNLPYREFMSVGLVVNELNLKNNTNIKTINNIVPDSWIYVQEPDVKMGRIQILNNWSPYLFKNKKNIENEVLITLEYFCSENDKYWNMSDKEFIDFAIDEAVKIGIINDNSVKSSVRIKIPKAYPAYFGTYSDIDKVVDYLNSISNLYCIGRNGQHRYNNMDHSMLTGIEAARAIIKGEKNKDDIWKVNTEKEYHEKK